MWSNWKAIHTIKQYENKEECEFVNIVMTHATPYYFDQCSHDCPSIMNNWLFHSNIHDDDRYGKKNRTRHRTRKWTTTQLNVKRTNELLIVYLSTWYDYSTEIICSDENELILVRKWFWLTTHFKCVYGVRYASVYGLFCGARATNRIVDILYSGLYTILRMMQYNVTNEHPF